MMKSVVFGTIWDGARRSSRLVGLGLVMVSAACAGAGEARQPAPQTGDIDPRVGLEAGWRDAGAAGYGVDMVAHVDRPEGFYDPDDLGNLLLGNTDMAFRGDLLFVGSFHGFNIYDISQPTPRLVTSFVCPGGQGDLSVYGDLLFMSVEMPNARTDCGTMAPQERVSPDRFRGVRIFDISDIQNPRQVGQVQTCRGSHTHTLLTAPSEPGNVYIYVSGTSTVRPAEELAGCVAEPGDPETALFRIEVIQVPIADPQDARIVEMPRIFADPETGDIAGLYTGSDPAEGAQETAITDQCHDITVFEELSIAAGACSGNGILLDIREPASPVRVDEVFDPNFAYWHSATFNNDGSKVLFTDEWGGGAAARCLATDRPRWGADAIFRLEDRRELELAGYYKLPAPQTEQENCVAHNGSLVPVPGRDIMAQAWYQGGMSIFDFTDPDNPVEIAYFDRGPYSASELLLGGYWSTYWYNGRIYGSEIGRGLDVFRLVPTEHLTQNEIDAASLVRQERFNPQTQTLITWPAEPVVARALLDQLERGENVPAAAIDSMRAALARAEGMGGRGRETAFTELAGMASDVMARARNDAERQRIELLERTFVALGR